MKKLLIVIAALVALLVLSTVVSAALTLPDEVLLGSKSQRRNNPEADDESDMITYIETTFLIKSSVDANNVEVKLDGDITNKAKYNATLSVVTSGVTASEFNTVVTNGLKLNLKANVFVTLKVKSMVPKDLDAINTEYKEAPQSIGTIIAYDGISTSTAPLKMQAENKLWIDSVDVAVNDGSSDSYDNTDEIKDIRPGDKLKFDIKVQNKFRDNDREGLDIDSTIKLDFGSDLNIDCDNQDDSDVVSPNGDYTASFECDIDKDVVQGTYDVIVTTYGDDYNGAGHGEQWKLNLRVTRDTHDLQIQDMTLEPEQIECGKTATLTVGVTNIGKKDEKNSAVSIKSLTLNGLSQKSDYEKINEGNDKSFVFYIDVPKGQPAGQYRIDVQTYYDMSNKLDSDTVILTVLCAKEEVKPPVLDIEHIQPGETVKATIAVPVAFVMDANKHTLSVTSYDHVAESAVVVISSTPQTLSLAKGTPRRVDLNLDNKSDLVVTLLGISQDGVLSIQVQEVIYGAETPSMVVTGQYTGTTTPTGAGVAEPEPSLIESLGGSGYVIAIAIVDIVVLIVAIVLIAKAVRRD